jgi:hypothetical protein
LNIPAVITDIFYETPVRKTQTLSSKGMVLIRYDRSHRADCTTLSVVLIDCSPVALHQLLIIWKLLK